MNKSRAALAGLLAAGALSACGGATPPPSAAPNGRESQGEPGAPSSYQQPGYSQPDVHQQQQPGGIPPVGGDGAPTGGFAQPPAPDALGPRWSTVDDAETALSAAASELASAGDDCTTACKALASMERASDRICELNGPDDPGERCKDARVRLETARKRVQDRCVCAP